MYNGATRGVVMDWKLVVSLSGFGLAMALGTVFVIPSSIEPFFWLPIFIVCAVLIARKAPGKHFLHGFCTSLVNCFWITTAHVAFFDTYAAGHAEEMAASAGMPFPPRVAMLLVGPIIGIVSGIVLGTFAFIAGKLIKPS